tara:strand:+ start:11949 stop:12494 length:546 start_codon:yes stop_codon:yes gene_type:complete
MILEIKKAVKHLKKGGIIIYPSDTIWAIGCDATNESSIDKIYKIKKRDKNLPFICLMNDYKMVRKYTNLSKSAKNIIELQKEPTTVIYDNVRNLKTFDNSIAIRVPKDIFCNKLLNKFDKPIISTSVNFSGKKHPIFYNEICNSILEKVDYVVELRKNERLNKASKIIKIKNDNTIKIIRS